MGLHERQAAEVAEVRKGQVTLWILRQDKEFGVYSKCFQSHWWL